MPLALKNAGGIQKFRIPFKNLSEHDFEVQFEFIQTSQAVSAPALRRSDSMKSNCPRLESSEVHQSPIEFSI